MDFVANKGSARCYVQSALTVDGATRDREVNSLNRIGDSFRKMIVVRDEIVPRHDENGILYVGVERFLLDDSLMDF